jgi:hypothetical protein
MIDCCIIIHKAQCHRELDYDRVFRQQAAIDPIIILHLAIQVSTLFSAPHPSGGSQGPAAHAGTQVDQPSCLVHPGLPAAAITCPQLRKYSTVASRSL